MVKPNLGVAKAYPSTLLIYVYFLLTMLFQFLMDVISSNENKVAMLPILRSQFLFLQRLFRAQTRSKE